MGRLDGKVTIVTGGARVLGRAVVETCAREGARVTFFDLDAAGARATVEELRACHIAAECLSADVSREADVAAAVAAVAARHGGVDVLVNNAGVNAYFEATSMTEAQW